jgi:23S rRNA (pseudouridine1915-N3)-methyltransferase
MKLAILAVGHKPPAWVAKGCAEYVKRMPRELPLSIVEVKPNRAARKVANNCWPPRKSACWRHCRLSANGRPRRARRRPETLQLAERLAGWMRSGGATAFVIGGADGIDEALKRQADESIRLSSLTLPHALARLDPLRAALSRHQRRPQPSLPSGRLMSFDMPHPRVHPGVAQPAPARIADADRRRLRYHRLSAQFTADDPELDETPLPGENPTSLRRTRIARNKAEPRLACRQRGESSARSRCWPPIRRSNWPGELIGKPHDVDDARRILRAFPATRIAS